MSRKLYEWKIRDKTLQLGERTLVMGILNVTPDSFSDGGKYSDPDRAFARAMELEEEGADIIDIGAESMRPGSTRVSEAEELRRLVPVLKRLQGRLTVPLSVDTYKSGVAAKALELGADIINDPTGLTADPEISRAAAQANAGLILNHMRGTPETWAKLPPLKDPMANLAMELDSAMHRAVRQGLERKRIVIDPGLGFGKRKEQNSEILARLDELASLDLPIMVGPSRKHFLAREAPVETEFASAAAVAAAVLYGAHIVRVHDVRTMKVVVEVADEIGRARAAQEVARQEASKQEGSRQARPERPSAGGPREARPPGSRPQEGNPRPQEPRFEDRRDTRVAFRSEDDDVEKSRQPLRPPTSKSTVTKHTEESIANLSTSHAMTDPGDSIEESGAPASETSLEEKSDALDTNSDAILEVKKESVGFRVARPPFSTPPSSKPAYSRPAASGARDYKTGDYKSGGYKSGGDKSRDSRSRDSRPDDRRESRPPSRDSGSRGDRPPRPSSRPLAYGSRDSRDARSGGSSSRDSNSRDSNSGDRRDSRSGPRQGSFGRPSGPPRTGRSFSGPPRSDRPSGPPRGKSFSGPRSDRPSGPRSDRPSGPPRGKPFTPRRPGNGSGSGRRPPGRG